MKKATGLAILAVFLLGLVWAEPVIDHPTGNRTTPPMINSISPLGLSRGITTELTIEGFNLGGTNPIAVNPFYIQMKTFQGQIS